MTHTSGFRVERLLDARQFLAVTTAFRNAHPVQTNAIGTIALGVASGREYDQTWWWVVLEGDTVIGCACRTAPYKLTLSPMPSSAAVALAHAVSEADLEVPGLGGPQTVVEAMLEALADPREQVVEMDDVVHVLGDFVPVVGVAGVARIATYADMNLLVPWFNQFRVDAEVPIVGDVIPNVRSRLDLGGMWIWEVDYQPVAMAGHAQLVETPGGKVGRIGPVYTPLEHRRQGYGAAVTAAVVEALLPQCSTVMLFADAHNPTSNAVYERLGFRVVARAVETALV
jgi:predicted GNAT family acetyltransferase